MPSLKDTLHKRIVEHIGGTLSHGLNKTRGIITLPNGSEIIPISWSDNPMKVRSYELSAVVIEELTENEDLDFYNEILNRVGRLRHVKEKWILSLTNPDDPSHPAYKYFIEGQSPTRHVYYSKTRDNPYLPESYVNQLEAIMDPKMVRRMLYGEWLSINQDVVYYAYEREHNFIDQSYVIKENHAIHICFDFNIGEGKPLSCVLFQYVSGKFHFFMEVIVQGQNTEDCLEELHGRGLFDLNNRFIIHGDATGRHRDTRSRHSDYSIIRDFLDHAKTKSGVRVPYSLDVPLSNPKIRERHNIVNGQIHNKYGRNVLVYKDCKTLDEGWRLTKLKAGANYLEDDSKYYQHVTTAAGYGIIAMLNSLKPSIIKPLQR